MRTSMVLASLLLLLLATRTHGIRMDRKLHAAINRKEMDGSNGQQPIAHLMGKHCTSDGHCSGLVMKRLLTHTELGAPRQSTTKRNDTTAEATQHSRHRGSEEANRPAGLGQEAAVRATAQHVPKQPQAYPDILDIAGMDYSPATRKPPIHN